MTKNSQHIKGLALQGISLAIGEHYLVQNLNLQVDCGEIAVFMGASGSGKSSLLAYICGALEKPLQASGQVFLNGENITQLPIHMRQIGLLFQEDLLFPHMSVGENLAFALRTVKYSRARIKAEVMQALQQAGLPDFAERDPYSLSGGQKARVSVMRCLLAQPRALLLDEPFSRLDLPLRRSFRQFVFKKILEKRVPTILVTHDPADARASGGKTISMERLLLSKFTSRQKN